MDHLLSREKDNFETTVPKQQFDEFYLVLRDLVFLSLKCNKEGL